MATNLGLDEKLVEEAQRTGRHKTKKEAVNAALEAYVRHNKQQRIIRLFGKIDYDPAYEYKAARRKR
jgi:Arc/MetJ family transcription regulator